MATYSPQPQIPANPHQDFPLNTPPDQAMFHMNNGHQPGGFAQMPNAMRNTHRMSAEYRGNALANGSKATPTGPQARVANTGSRNFGAHSGGPFDGPRSPPNTKSMCLRREGSARASTDLRATRYLSRALQILQDRTVSGWESLPILALDGHIEV